MSGEAVTREGADRFLIELGELARKVNRGHRRGDPVLVDPFLIARTIAEVMRAARSCHCWRFASGSGSLTSPNPAMIGSSA